MEEQEVLKKLCYYDQRNPDCVERDIPLPKNKDCYCDNCFHGRTPLAEELLMTRSVIYLLVNKIDESTGGVNRRLTVQEIIQLKGLLK